MPPHHSRMIQTIDATMPIQTIIVKIAAPALSPVVIGLNVTAVVVEDVSPAFGSLVDLAPVDSDSGAN